MLESESRQGVVIPLLLPSRASTILRFQSVADMLPFNFGAEDLPAV